VPSAKALFTADPAISFESEQVQVAFPIGCVVDWRPASRTRLAWVAFGLGCPTVVIGVLAILSGRLWMLTIMQVPCWVCFLFFGLIVLFFFIILFFYFPMNEGLPTS
jgi:hypothetical protein